MAGYTLDLALLQPGVTESNDDNNGAGNYSIAGGRSDSVTFLLDGGLNNDLLDNSNLLDPNPDAIAEFRLLTSNYTAEYGRNGGGIISVVTKSGTNQLHGSLFEFFRNRVLDANDYFNIKRGFRGWTSNVINMERLSGVQSSKIACFSSLLIKGKGRSKLCPT